MLLTVLIEPWSVHPLTWIHRAEARAIVAELRDAGQEIRLATFRRATPAMLPGEPLLLRLSDPTMHVVTAVLARAAVAYIGPGAATMERCYDKYEATRRVLASGVDAPATRLGSAVDAPPPPLILKPRHGSDSLGLRVLPTGRFPSRARSDDFIVQEQVRGTELTVAVLGDRVGVPLRIVLPEGTPYRFWRKYLWSTPRAPLRDEGFAARVRDAARSVARTLGVDWAARIDFIHERATGRLCFLECDVAPLVGPRSAFAASLGAAGMARADQLRALLGSTQT
jgi:carbamoylphosphate synthase large subunit